MRVLMFGWEFPPMNNGGLGTACFGLTRGLSNHNVHVTFVLPRASFLPENSHVDFVIASTLKNVNIKKVDSALIPYVDGSGYQRWKSFLTSHANKDMAHIYGENLFEEVYRYAEVAKIIAKHEQFDIIHAHDWMTYKAAKAARTVSGKPMVVHIHATEFDRTGGNLNQVVYDIEREGFHAADRIIAVSNFTRDMVIKHYAVPAEKVVVVHNAVDHTIHHHDIKRPDNDKIVLFLGRITIQKGPDYFLDAAKMILEKRQDVKFIIAGSGDMAPAMIEKAAHMGIADKVLFTGFLKGPDIDKAYQMADVYVMPSVSEPFGIAPLEALKNKTPVIISKQSGVSEVLKNALKVDFWDINQLANKILAVLEHASLKETLRDEGYAEVQGFNWDTSAAKCIDVYNEVLKW